MQFNLRNTTIFRYCIHKLRIVHCNSSHSNISFGPKKCECLFLSSSIDAGGNYV